MPPIPIPIPTPSASVTRAMETPPPRRVAVSRRTGIRDLLVVAATAAIVYSFMWFSISIQSTRDRRALDLALPPSDAAMDRALALVRSCREEGLAHCKAELEAAIRDRAEVDGLRAQHAARKAEILGHLPAGHRHQDSHLRRLFPTVPQYRYPDLATMRYRVVLAQSRLELDAAPGSDLVRAIAEEFDTATTSRRSSAA